MPAPGFHRVANAFHRPWEDRSPVPYSDLPGLSRGEIRLAGEVGIAQLSGHHVPHEIKCRTILIYEQMTRG
jgi:hypothetical protein